MGMNSTATSRPTAIFFHILIKGRRRFRRQTSRLLRRVSCRHGLTAEYYLQTSRRFPRTQVPRGQMVHRDPPRHSSKIKRVALMTVEGEKGRSPGWVQTFAAQTLCTNLARGPRAHQPPERRRPITVCSTVPAFVLKLLRKFAVSSRPTSAGKASWRGPSAGLPKAGARAPVNALLRLLPADWGPTA